VVDADKRCTLGYKGFLLGRWVEGAIRGWGRGEGRGGLARLEKQEGELRWLGRGGKVWEGVQ